METYQAIILGIIQGLTEFLPVSSSGHLVLTQHLFGLKEPALFFDISLHMGTLVAVLVVFRRDIAAMLRALASLPGAWARRGSAALSDREVRLALFIVLGSIPTAILGLCFKEIAHTLFSSTILVGVMLLVTAALLWTIRGDRQGSRPVDTKSSLVIGLIQGLAVIPGISRSGSTIVTGLFLGLSREDAGKFSFLLSIPAIMGAELLGILEMRQSGIAMDAPTLLGTMTSFAVGYGALKLLLGLVRQGRLHLFSPYCAIVGILAITLGFF